jgi:hypothetical protein
MLYCWRCRRVDSYLLCDRLQCLGSMLVGLRFLCSSGEIDVIYFVDVLVDYDCSDSFFLWDKTLCSLEYTCRYVSVVFAAFILRLVQKQ